MASDLFSGTLLLLNNQILGGHQHSRRAEAAMQRLTRVPFTVSVVSTACSMRARAAPPRGAAWWAKNDRDPPEDRGPFPGLASLLPVSLLSRHSRRGPESLPRRGRRIFFASR